MHSKSMTHNGWSAGSCDVHRESNEFSFRVVFEHAVVQQLHVGDVWRHPTVH